MPNTPVEISTLNNIFYQGVKNDVSFKIEDRFVVFLEHQTSISENLPMRMLLYASKGYEFSVDKKKLHKVKLIKVPTPEFYVLYNGEKNAPKERILKLLDAFTEVGKPLALELKVKFININLEESSELLERSKTLREYSYFIDMYRRYLNEGYTEKVAMKKAYQHCVGGGIMEEFLRKYEAEVLNTDILAWTYEESMTAER